MRPTWSITLLPSAIIIQAVHEIQDALPIWDTAMLMAHQLAPSPVHQSPAMSAAGPKHHHRCLFLESAALARPEDEVDGRTSLGLMRGLLRAEQTSNVAKLQTPSAHLRIAACSCCPAARMLRPGIVSLLWPRYLMVQTSLVTVPACTNGPGCCYALSEYWLQCCACVARQLLSCLLSSENVAVLHSAPERHFILTGQVPSEMCML